MAITATGNMPATILENGRAGDWSATLALSSAATVSDVRLTGEDAALFQASLGAGNQVIITPAGLLDREAFPAGADPVLDFGLSVQVGGTWQPVSGGWSITLLGLDDTAPSDLRFSSGGVVLETDIGAEIGTLLATDPDSPAAQLQYRVLWPDEAFFEVVGTTLKLRQGVDLLRLGGTVRDVMIAVSDGLNEAAFSLGVTVLDVTTEDAGLASAPLAGPTPATAATTPGITPAFATATSPATSSAITGATVGTASATPASTAGTATTATGTTTSSTTGTTGPGVTLVQAVVAPAQPDADVVVTFTGATTDVAEGGATDTFTIQLSRQPTAPVTVTLSVGEELNLARSTTGVPSKNLSFTIAVADWAKPRTVIVSAVDDAEYEGTHSARVVINTASSDASFSNLPGRGLDVTVYDNEVAPLPSPPPPAAGTPPGLALVETSAVTAVAERGAGDSITVALKTRPLANVTLTISGGPDLLLALSGNTTAPSVSLTFTPSDWANPRAVILSAVNDALVEGTETASLAFALASDDPAYHRLAVPGLGVLVTDSVATPANSTPSSPPAPPSDTLSPGTQTAHGAMSRSGAAVMVDRAADAAGVTERPDGLLIAWRDGTSTLVQNATSIAFSEGELVFGGNTAAARALRAYEAIWGDAPAPNLAQTASLLSQKVSMGTVARSLIEAPQWASRTAALNPMEKISLIYQDVVGYAAPKEALDYLTWANGAGASLAQIAAMLIDSPQAVAFSEAQNPTGIWVMNPTERSVVQAYDAVLDQMPDQASVARWSLLLHSGLTLRDLYTYLSATDLFQARHATQSNAAFVESAYQQALERPPTRDELLAAKQLLDQGQAGRVDILLSLGVKQAEIGLAPGAGHTEQTVYPETQADRDVLGRGQSLADIANSTKGHAVTTHAAAEVARIDVAADGLALHWAGGGSVRLGAVDSLTFADGTLAVDGNTPIAAVTRVYEATLGGTPSGYSLSAYDNMLASGAPLSFFSTAFLNTPQAQARLAGLDAAGQISLIYKGLFGYGPPADAMAYLQSVLRLGTSLSDLTSWLAQLPEAAAAFEKSHPTGVWVPDFAASTVVRAFDAMLNTTPDPVSLLIWRNAVPDPYAVKVLYQTLMETDLHHAMYDGVSDEAWVAGHYQAAMESAGNSRDLAASVALLSRGVVSHLDMAQALGEMQPLVEPPRVVSNVSVDLL